MDVNSDLYMRRVIDNLSVDLSTLSSESKRKYITVKEASELCLLKLRQINNLKTNLHKTLCESSLEIIQPLILGCDTKQSKIIQLCLTSLQKVVEAKILNINSATIIVDTLWHLCDSSLEELKVLQSIAVLVNSSEIIKHHLLAKTLTIGLRLCSSKDLTISNTASAMVSQMVNTIFERVSNEPRENLKSIDFDKLKNIVKDAPKSLDDACQDAFMLLQDLYLLLNSDIAIWLYGVYDINKVFGLELLKCLLVKYPKVFFMNPEMSFVLKERVCPLLIKLFSPTVKSKSSVTNSLPQNILNQQTQSQSSNNQTEKHHYLIVSRLIRIVFVLAKYYFELIITECEIFLSLVIKYIEIDVNNTSKTAQWQKALAIEFIYKVVTDPQMLKQICLNYDMKQHTEKILQTIVNCISTYLYHLFITSSSGSNSKDQQQQQQQSQYHQIFLLKETFISLLPIQLGQYKTVYIDTWDKNELPLITDTYLITACFYIIQEYIKSIRGLIMDGESDDNHDAMIVYVNASTLLFTLNYLLDTCIDDQYIDFILRSLKQMIYLCCKLKIKERDLFLLLICKYALPLPNYIQYVFNLKEMLNGTQNYEFFYNYLNQQQQAIGIVAIGSPLNGSVQSQQLMITNKNLQIMKFLLDMCLTTNGQEKVEKLARLFDYNSWYIFLNTMEHLTWVLNLKPMISSIGQLNVESSSTSGTPTTPSSSTPTTTTSSIQNDLVAICKQFTQIFEYTKEFSDVEGSLVNLINALIKLTNECYNNVQNISKTSEPCLFALCKLYELTHVNMHRIEQGGMWNLITGHLLDLCKHPNIKLREYCLESLCLHIKTAFNLMQAKGAQESDEDTRSMLLVPLQELSYIQFNDIRQKQLECTLTILRLSGQYLSKKSWPIVLTIIGSINKEQNEILIRSAFQCLQLVVTDFLPMIQLNYLNLIISVVSKFGFQEQDLNISLTAIVLLWNISDYMYTSKGDSQEEVWMLLYSRLSELCVDQRPAVRKSAGQTLFCTISSHSSVLTEAYWLKLINDVLFKLLDNVKCATQSASKERLKQLQNTNFLMHHSRDTAEKQWAETSVLTLNGITKVFNQKCFVLYKLNDFYKMWLYLLEFIEYSALLSNIEISLASLKSLHELLGNNNYYSSSNTIAVGNSTSANNTTVSAIVNTNLNGQENDEIQQHILSPILKYLDPNTHWMAAWKLWINIGMNLKQVSSQQQIQQSQQSQNDGKTNTLNKKSSDQQPQIQQVQIPLNQTYLTCYMDLMPVILDVIAFKFNEKDFESYSLIIDKILLIPVLNGDFASFIMQDSTSQSGSLTPLQNSCLNSIKHFIQLAKTNEIFEDKFMSLVFQRLLSFVLYACSSNTNSKTSEYANINFVPFGERSLVILTNLYEEYANHRCIVDNQVFKLIIQTLYTPLSMKYACPNPSTWKLAIECLFRILRRGLPTCLKSKTNSTESMWNELAKTFEDFLFTKNIGSAELTTEAIQKDEQIDCQVIELIRDEILTQSNQIPAQFIQKILAILNRGSIYSNVSESFLDFDSIRKLREEFSKACFESLLKFSFISDSSSITVDNGGNSLNRMALTSMLQRCKDIIQHYAHDERLNGNVPLPKPRTKEMICVLKALCTLINSLKKAPKENVQISVWNQIIALYPCLVECTTSPSSQICASVKDALHHYFALLSVPTSS